LTEKLKAERPGILAWCVQGCLNWQELGLAPPRAVRDATDAYLAEEDTIGRWLEECCGVDPTYTDYSAELYSSWVTWAEKAGERPGSKKRFGQALVDRGFKTARDNVGKRQFSGLALRSLIVS
jgi:phage/plasmid-associated DNA primase